MTKSSFALGVILALSVSSVGVASAAKPGQDRQAKVAQTQAKPAKPPGFFRTLGKTLTARTPGRVAANLAIAGAVTVHVVSALQGNPIGGEFSEPEWAAAAGGLAVGAAHVGTALPRAFAAIDPRREARDTRRAAKTAKTAGE